MIILAITIQKGSSERCSLCQGETTVSAMTSHRLQNFGPSHIFGVDGGGGKATYKKKMARIDL